MRKHLPAILYAVAFIVLGFCAFIAISCSGNPAPVPQPTPIPTPTPTPAPIAMTPLTVSGTKFMAGGKPITLLGPIACCSNDSKTTSGWPLASEEYIIEAAANGATFLNFRLGPNNGPPPTGAEIPTTLFVGDPQKYDFDAYLRTPKGKGFPAWPDGIMDLRKWDNGFWSRLRRLIQIAQDHKMRVMLSVADMWTMRHHLCPWLEGDDPSVKLVKPLTWHQAWIIRVAEQTCQYPAILYEEGNEDAVPPGMVATPWSDGMADLIHQTEAKNGCGRHLIGSSAYSVDGYNKLSVADQKKVNDVMKSSRIDFVILHQETAPRPQFGKPTIVDEFGGSAMKTAATWSAEARKARGLGTTIELWRNGMERAEYVKALAEIPKILAGN